MTRHDGDGGTDAEIKLRNTSLSTATQPKQPVLRLTVDQVTSCDRCAYRGPCGGLDQNAAWGCFLKCFTSCDQEKCDYVCPSRPREYVRRMQEVGGFDRTLDGSLAVPEKAPLPLYIPVIYSGSSRTGLLDAPMVALPFHRVLTLRNGRYSCRSLGPEALHEEFRLAPQTQVLITSVAFDHFLEKYWRYARAHGSAEQLATLGLFGMTIPNFSYFSDAPRTDILYNRRRAMIVACQLSEAGVPVVPHMNALTPGDWDFWAEFLRDQPQLRFIAKEFQTGLSHQRRGEEAIRDLARLQDRAGRELHPILVGAGRYVPDATRYFRTFSIVDSRPFMETVKRRRFVPNGQGEQEWVKHPTERGEPLDSLLRYNVVNYSRAMTLRHQSARSRPVR